MNTRTKIKRLFWKTNKFFDKSCPSQFAICKVCDEKGMMMIDENYYCSWKCYELRKNKRLNFTKCKICKNPSNMCSEYNYFCSWDCYDFYSLKIRNQV